ncbi:histidine--tRNA ligase [Tissierella sp. Yu-01]|uniref:histidine--tRNA ligase n=1 Tax=Tissierella sp. Yu-01 TaxID=3035694 RepID=UPI00240E1048|nr:histidine--tRNA ligase [Tissierella sp. Yu-01]WFA09888.1 histidine--tRNA ligase [Tissierella sp. Yu-01]
MSVNIVKPSILPGFMELTPSDQILFNKMMDTIRKNYEKFGFLPIDTPLIEKSEVLLAKGGGETEKQIYKVVKGDTDMSLRFDLTVPLARYVAQYYSELSFPYRRYHIGKVYRGERNQKGRFREFYQADIDIIGNGSLDVINDAEIPSVIYSTFKDLGFDSFTIKINNRKILSGFFNSLGIEDATYVLRVVDKLEKIGVDNVTKELGEIGISLGNIEKILEFISINGNNNIILKELQNLNIDNELFNIGLDELSKVVEYIRLFGVPENNFVIDLTIARGLDYYTGTVYETFLNDYPSIGSVCSGGRYDDLATYYTKQKLPGVGISIGLTRLFYQLTEGGIIKSTDNSLTQVLIIPMEGYMDYAIKTSSLLRKEDIYTQVYLEEGKMGKKFNYADKLNIPYVIVVGQEEAENNKYSFRNMKTGDQKIISIDEVLECLK